MKNFLGHIIIFVLFATCTLFAILPNPLTEGVFTKTQWQEVNDFFEKEETSQISQFSPHAACLDWETSVSAIFQPFQNTRIFELSTQKSFWVQRTGGTNHADVEPLSEKDAQIFLEITKQKKSNRLAVLVNLNETWVCASISTKPHGFSLITDNNFSGHLCLHFSGSKTDATQKIDYLHQKAIKQAQKISKKIFPKN